MDVNASTSATSPPVATPHQPPLLPPEILVEIFLLLLAPPNQAQAPQKTTLSLVCRYWNSIIESTPMVWSQISIADTASYIQKSLRKSGELLLDVNGARISDEGRMIGRCDGVCCGFMKDIIRHSDRWRHAALQISCCDTPHGPMVLKRSLLSLKSLKILSEVVGPLDSEFLELLKAENAPNLHEVVLNFNGLPEWNISFPPSLSKLAIYDIPNLSPTLIEVLSVLIGCPNLTILQLCGVDIRMDDRVDGHANTPTVVDLANLEELKLEGLTQDLFQDLFGRLRFPGECTFSISCTIHGASPSTSFLTPTVSRYYRSFDCAGEIEKATVVLNEYELRLEVACQKGWRIGLSLDGAQALRDSLKWFGISTEEINATPHLGSSSTRFTKSSRTPVSFNVGDIPTEQNLNFLISISELECITRIEASGSTEQQRLLLWYLRGHDHPDQPTADRQNTSLSGLMGQSYSMRVHPFPRLRELVAKGVEFQLVIDVECMVRSRRRNNATVGASGNPVRLKRLEFVDKNDEGVQG
ncbi:hypothetical protein FS837_006983 [Tulasnella sp. UAMH 9824]|nr:hypothetical protein FS837_006983 [Tulasnella sp. UAMH 9824]